MPTQAALSRYASAMTEINLRLDAVDTLHARTLQMDNVDQPPEWLFTWEQIAVHLRKVVELIVFSSMVAHQDKYREVYPDFASHWKIGKILKKLETIHPAFFPISTKITTTAEGAHHAPMNDDPKASRADLEVLYDKCSDLIHAFQPFKYESGAVIDLMFTPPQWTTLIRGLLQEHFIMLFGNQTAFMVQMTAPPDGFVRVALLQAEGPATHVPSSASGQSSVGG
ncbi:hypothetical protein QTH87_13490 [Variovorax sp. J22P168]|uniref:hypothetical protein n=1 Tax=Variovorax jilinensis TaxID=3053513 RepID=UPI002578E148|nr:hypothetical protein [Variovorax sp. J22P168]MDM0013450.1 hypothetical protein [Variovorax sp. J22P168]